MQKCSPRPATAVTVRHASRGASAGGHPPSDRCSWGGLWRQWFRAGTGDFLLKGPEKKPFRLCGPYTVSTLFFIFCLFLQAFKNTKATLSLQTAQKQPWLADPWFRTRTLTLDGVPVLTRPPLPGAWVRGCSAPQESPERSRRHTSHGACYRDPGFNACDT